MKRELVPVLVVVFLLTSLPNVAFTVQKVQANRTTENDAFSLLTLQSDMPVVHVDPQNIEANIGETFTIYLKIFNLSNNFYQTDELWEQGEPLGPPGVRHNYSLGGLSGVEIHFKWDPNVLDYIEHNVTAPVEDYPEGVLHEPLINVWDEVDAEAGTYLTAKACMYPAEAFNRPDENSTLFSMTFTVLKQGVSELNITSSDLVIPSAYPEYNDANAEIPHWRMNGIFQTPELATRIASLDVKPLDNGTFFTLPVITGENAFIASTIINDGNLTDTYNLTLHWGPTLLNSWMNETLELGEQKSYNHTVNGAELSIGNHTITATISVLHNTSTYIEELIEQFRVIGVPTLTILGPFSAEPGDTIYYTANSTHADPEGEIVGFIWALWGPDDLSPRAEQIGENATFELDPFWIGSYLVTLDVEDNYGVEYNESRPTSHAWHTEKSMEIIPEFPSLLLLPLFLLGTLLAAIVYRRKKNKVCTS